MGMDVSEGGKGIEDLLRPKGRIFSEAFFLDQPGSCRLDYQR